MVHVNLPEVLRREHVDAAAHLHSFVYSLVDEEVLNGVDDLFFVFTHPFFSGYKAQNCKMVRVGSRYRLVVR